MSAAAFDLDANSPTPPAARGRYAGLQAIFAPATAPLLASSAPRRANSRSPLKGLHQSAMMNGALPQAQPAQPDLAQSPAPTPAPLPEALPTNAFMPASELSVNANDIKADPGSHRTVTTMTAASLENAGAIKPLTVGNASITMRPAAGTMDFGMQGGKLSPQPVALVADESSRREFFAKQQQQQQQQLDAQPGAEDAPQPRGMLRSLTSALDFIGGMAADPAGTLKGEHTSAPAWTAPTRPNYNKNWAGMMGMKPGMA